MPKLVTIEDQLTVEQLEQGYRNAREVTEKIHLSYNLLMAMQFINLKSVVRLSTNGYGFMVSSTLNLERRISMILPEVNTELFSRVLTDKAMRISTQLNQNKRILLVLDQAG